MINTKKISANQAIDWKRDFIRKQKKFKEKYQIFAKELDGISLSNWKSNIVSDMTNANDFSQLNELIHSINGGNLL
jgi:hypothetical protein